MSTLLTRIREATASAHQLLEQSPASRIITSPGLSLPDYADYLKKMYTIHREVEDVVFPVAGAVITDVASRLKTEGLRMDLSDLGQTPPEHENFLDSGFRPDLSFCLGMMYVTEGSTLGGLFILKNVLAVLGSKVQQAHRFFTAYGPHTGSYWKNFLAQLAAYEACAGAAAADAVVAGAVYGFACTSRLFNQPLPHPQVCL